ncbi:suppressor of fused domain protein [Pedobacter sp. SYP-B3415]|uniref:suppressor of fused domain protein n=1 Tax=Pedobacter sp. SYP-B3415 TaxID=2496641 RepID=UPI00101C2C54|nr:suppressor of fused domain protein [Pedobacter sp. SYP-B3415]
MKTRPKPMSANASEEHIRQHYINSWGNNFEIRKWLKGPNVKSNSQLEILEFKPTAQRMCWTYATCGMSSATQNTPVELHMFSETRDEGIIELLTAVSDYHHTGSNLSLWHTVNFGQPWQGTSRCEYGLISLPYLDGPKLETLKFNAQMTVNFYWLIPITAAEREYKIKNGVDALEEQFEKSNFNYLNPDRQSVV